MGQQVSLGEPRRTRQPEFIHQDMAVRIRQAVRTSTCKKFDKKKELVDT